MPSRYIHKKLSKILLDEKCENTHKLIDYPVKFFGSRHRVFFHDPISAVLIGFLSDGYKGAISGILHILADKYVSHYTEKFLKYLISKNFN